MGNFMIDIMGMIDVDVNIMVTATGTGNGTNNNNNNNNNNKVIPRIALLAIKKYKAALLTIISFIYFCFNIPVIWDTFWET